MRYSGDEVAYCRTIVPIVSQALGATIDAFDLQENRKSVPPMVTRNSAKDFGNDDEILEGTIRNSTTRQLHYLEQLLRIPAKLLASGEIRSYQGIFVAPPGYV